MKKLCLILLMAAAAFVSLSSTPARAAGFERPGNFVPVTVRPGQQPVFVQTDFGTIGFLLYENPCPQLGVISSPAAISQISIAALALNQTWVTGYLANSYYATVPVFGNDKYSVTIETNMGTFTKTINIQGLPNYAPGDPRIPCPIDDFGKF